MWERDGGEGPSCPEAAQLRGLPGEWDGMVVERVESGGARPVLRRFDGGSAGGEAGVAVEEASLPLGRGWGRRS